MEGGGGEEKKCQELKRKEGKGNESTLHSKCLVCKGERKGKKSSCSITDSLLSISFQFGRKGKMLALWRTQHFPFPHFISLQTYILIIFLPIVFINHCIEYGVARELAKSFFFQRDGNRIHDEENEGCLCSSRVLFCIFFFK